jgi:hypothetical protein
MTNDAALTRRRSDNPHEEIWYIFSDDVRISALTRKVTIRQQDTIHRKIFDGAIQGTVRSRSGLVSEPLVDFLSF